MPTQPLIQCFIYVLTYCCVIWVSPFVVIQTATKYYWNL